MFTTVPTLSHKILIHALPSYLFEISFNVSLPSMLGLWDFWFLQRRCWRLDVFLSVHRCICVEKKNQLDATEWFIVLIIRSTCFGHFCAHYQELEAMCPGIWMLHDSCNILLVQHPSSWTHNLLSCTRLPTTSNQALHTIGGNNTHIASSSWWWA